MRDYADRLGPVQRELLRSLGGLLVFAGILALSIRKDEEWGDAAQLLLVLVPCVVFYLLGVGAVHDGRREPLPPRAVLLLRDVRARPSQAVLLVLGVILVPLALAQFLELIGADGGSSVNVLWIFLVTAALALYGSLAAGVEYAGLLGALALVVAWFALWDLALDDPSASTMRSLLVLLALLLAGAVVALERHRRRQAVEFATAAGIAAVGAGFLGLVAGAIGVVGSSFAGAFGAGAPDVSGLRQKTEWDVFLLLVSVALIWYATHRRARGPAYVGALGLLAFSVSVGAELVALFSPGGDAEGELFGWPLLLLVGGAVALVLGFLGRSPAQRPGPAPPTAPGERPGPASPPPPGERPGPAPPPPPAPGGPDGIP